MDQSINIFREVWDYEKAFLTPSSHQAADTNDDKWCEEYFVKQTDALDFIYLTQISGITGKTHAPRFSRNPSAISCWGFKQSNIYLKKSARTKKQSGLWICEGKRKPKIISVMKENKDDPDTGWSLKALMLIITIHLGRGCSDPKEVCLSTEEENFSGNSNLNLEMLLFKIWIPWALELTHRNSANLTPIFQSITGVWHHPIIVLSASRWKWRQMKWK